MSDVKPNRREMYAAQTRAAVLESALSLFVTKGYERTSVEDIARESQASKGAVYHHFSDKQEIFTEVFRASISGVLTVVATAMMSPGEPWEQLENSTRAFLHTYIADDQARILLLQALSVLGWERARAIDEEMSLPMIRATVAEFIRIGVIRQVSVDVTAELLLGLYVDAVLLISARPAEQAEAAAAAAEAVIMTMLGGLKAP